MSAAPHPGPPPADSTTASVTVLLHQWKGGDATAFERVVRALLAHATGDTASVLNARPAMYHCVTDQFVAGDGLGNLMVLNDGSNFTNPGTYALTQTGPDPIRFPTPTSSATTAATW